MADDIFRYFLKQMFPLYYTKCGFIKDAQVQEFVPKGALSKNLFTLILKSTCMLQDSIFLPWKTYLDVHKKLMVSSPEMYVAHVMRICLTDTSATTEIFEKLINVFGLVTTIGIATYGASRKKFYKMTPEILAVIFENKFEYDFKKCGGFKKFEKYLSCQDFIRSYDEIADYIDGSSPDCPHDTMQKLLRRVTERLVNFSVNVQVKRSTDDPEIDNLTRQVMSAIDVSVMVEICSSDKQSQDEKLKSSEELGAVGGIDLEFDGSSKDSEEYEELCVVGQYKGMESTLLDVMSKFNQVCFDKDVSLQESAGYVANYLESTMINVQRRVENAITILNLLA